VLDALANYFQHRDEWPSSDWSTLTDLSKRTADIVAAAGLTSGSTGNLRTGSTALGNVDYKSTARFGAIVGAWAETVLNRTRDAVKS
jgi:hypothetical protein